MKLAGAIICIFLTGSEGLHIGAPPRAPTPQKGGECTDDTHWGMWIDGRDAHHGEDFYGKNYNQSVESLLQKVYVRAKLNLAPDMDMFRDFAVMLGEKFREKDGYHALTSPVQICLKTFDTDQFDEIMGDVVVMDKTFKFRKGVSRGVQITELFEEYNKRQKLAGGILAQPEKQITAIAFLMHNLAFAHPLMDHNGRMRMLLMQHELRRLGLGCGTMLYNNNRDMCFNTPIETAEKIKEGMVMYNTWRKSGVNPWIDPANQKKHEATFARPNSEALNQCWAKHGQRKKCFHKGCNHKGTTAE